MYRKRRVTAEPRGRAEANRVMYCRRGVRVLSDQEKIGSALLIGTVPIM